MKSPDKNKLENEKKPAKPAFFVWLNQMLTSPPELAPPLEQKRQPEQKRPQAQQPERVQQPERLVFDHKRSEQRPKGQR